jgi:hypothetical protein
MARKILFTGANREIKKAVAILLVRRQVAEWVVKNVSIRLRAGAPTELPREPKPVTHYIPIELPPAELPGVAFQRPMRWKEETAGSLVVGVRYFPHDQRVMS